MKNPVVSVSSLEKSFWNHKVFQDLKFSLSWKKVVWIVWKNWVWKTTLFKILMNYAKKDSWNIELNWKIWYLPQEIYFWKSVSTRWYLKNFVQPWEDYKIQKILDDFWMWSINQKSAIWKLSWGQQRKLWLAKMVLQDKDILLLDEPTNHIDIQTRNWLEEFLLSFDWLVLIISHDRAFLNSVCNQILELENSWAVIYDWDYEDYKIAKQDRFEKLQLDAARYNRERKKWLNWLSVLEHRASLYDSPSWWKLLRAKRKFVEKNYSENKTPPSKDKTIITSLAGWTHGSKLMLKFSNTNIKIWYWYNNLWINNFENTKIFGTKNFPDIGFVENKLESTIQNSQNKKMDISEIEKVLIEKINIDIRWADRILISWKNGAWKTTLLNHIWQVFNWKTDKSIKRWNDIKVAYIDQHQLALDSQKSVFDEFRQVVYPWKAYDEALIASKLSQFGIEKDLQNLKISQLSYGQRVRVRFAQLVSKPWDLVIMDEPTNHLDIPTREAIENMLQEYEWAIILVSHDQYFVQQVQINRFFELENKRLKEIL